MYIYYRNEHRNKQTPPRLIAVYTSKAGLHIRTLLDDNFQVQRTDLSGAAVKPIVEQLVSGGARLAFSTRNDDVIDAWSIRDPKSETARIEVSTKRNGKADRWMTYEDGILMDTFLDANEDGQPDGPPAR